MNERYKKVIDQYAEQVSGQILAVLDDVISDTLSEADYMAAQGRIKEIIKAEVLIPEGETVIVAEGDEAMRVILNRG
jgi:hypothetical protein